MERLFLGIDLPPETRAALSRHLARAAPEGLPGRAVPVESWHLTLRFLGGSTPERRAALEEALSAAALGPLFAMELGALGAFPRPARATVLWIGVSRVEPGLARLAAVAEAAARQVGFTPEQRPFRAHLTLSRLRVPTDVAPLLQRTPAARLEMPVAAITLFRSALGGGPARYDRLASWPLSS